VASVLAGPVHQKRAQCRSSLARPGFAETDEPKIMKARPGLDVLTMTRSAYVQVRCAVVALWSERHPRYARRIRPASTKLDSILPNLPVLAV
jgi:hypothetical protein